jgi:hypothetical protein
MPKSPKRLRGRSPRPYQVFISHATLDKWVARVLCEKIDALAGVRTFRDDRDIHGGDDISEELREQLRLSDELVVLLTPVSVTRPWVTLEIGAAWVQGLWIVPICYHVGVDQVPTLLQKKKAYMLNDFDRYLVELQGRAGSREGSR